MLPEVPLRPPAVPRRLDKAGAPPRAVAELASQAAATPPYQLPLEQSQWVIQNTAPWDRGFGLRAPHAWLMRRPAANSGNVVVVDQVSNKLATRRRPAPLRCPSDREPDLRARPSLVCFAAVT
jgi:hypothetical protein